MRRFMITLVLLMLCGVLRAETPELFPFEASGEKLPEIWKSESARTPAGAKGQIRVEGAYFVNERGENVRLWGTNLCMAASFGDHETATAFAERMAAFGVNLVRLHHMDMREIWGKNFPRQTEIDPEQLERLDWLISEFKRNGIYVNINLHVSRQFRAEDGYPNPELRPSHDKGLDNFERRNIELQKKYARDLLLHVNPYTKMSYANDPCVAMVEINNENSILSTWNAGRLDTHCPPPFDEQLRALWNAWLVKCYGDTTSMRRAWHVQTVPLAENQTPLDDSSAWHGETSANSAAKLSFEKNTLTFEIQKQGDVAWEPQFYRPGVKITEGVPVTVRFRARADREMAVTLSCVQTHTPWGHPGLDQPLTLTTEWQDFEFVFLPKFTEDNARVGFTFFPIGRMELSDFSFQNGGEIGIPQSETLEAGNVRLPKKNSEFRYCTPRMRADFADFLIALEDGYWQEMYDFLKTELQVKAPVTGTQLQYGAAHAQARLDYCDNHSYWNHPVFPGNSWDGNNWYVTNRAMVDVFGTSDCLSSLAAHRVLGKPYTVSEYNNPYPNLYGIEGFVGIAAMAGFQDWSGVFLFDWSHSPKNPNTAGFFDMHGNPAFLVHQAACYNLFVRGDVRNGLEAEETLKVPSVHEVTEEFERVAIEKQANGDGSVVWRYLAAPRDLAYANYTGVRLPDLKIPESRSAAIPALDPSWMESEREKPTRTVSSTGQLRWDGSQEDGAYFVVSTPKTVVFTGFVPEDGVAFDNGTSFKIRTCILDWAALSLTEVGENRWLLAATGLERNSDMKIREYDPQNLGQKFEEIPDTPNAGLRELRNKRVTTCRANGHSPVLCEGICAEIRMPVPEGKKARIWALDGTGAKSVELPISRQEQGFCTFEISEKYKTLWYVIEWEAL